MQKIGLPEHRLALDLLEEALPADFAVRRRASAPSTTATPITISPPGLSPVEGWLVESLDIPVPEDDLRIVVLRGNAREGAALREAGQSFVDLSGAVHLKTQGLYVDRMGLPPARQDVSPSGVDSYSDRASRVARVLLLNRRSRRWTTSELATAAEVDVSTASRVVRAMRRRDLVVDEAPGQGRASRIGVTDPHALLSDWTRRYAWEDNLHIRVAAPVGSPSRFVPRLAESLTAQRWALSLQAGASLLAPHADFDTLHVYVDGDPNAVARQQGWPPSPSGKLVLMRPKYTQSTWFQKQTPDGIPVVSTVQLVLDLWHYPVRGREQAEHLIESILQPLWEKDA